VSDLHLEDYGYTTMEDVSVSHDWTIDLGFDNRFGLMQYNGTHCAVFLHRHILTLPFSAPLTAGILLLFVLLLLFAGYYCVANLRHKDAAGDA